jgi:hypothetical protein
VQTLVERFGRVELPGPAPPPESLSLSLPVLGGTVIVNVQSPFHL